VPKTAPRSKKASLNRSGGTRTKSAAPAKKKASPTQRTSPARSSRSRRQSSRPAFSWNRLSLDRKLDFLGIFLALIGFLTLLSLISSTQGTITSAWINVISMVAGWGAWVLPAALLVLGLWLVLRRIESLPQLSTERLTGVILLYLNLLAWLHLFAGGTWELAKAGVGGGYVGAFFQRGLVQTLGTAGGVVVMAAWLIIALVFTFDLSVPDIFHRVKKTLSVGGKYGAGRAGYPSRQAISNRHSIEPEALPPDFRPLPGQAAQSSAQTIRSKPPIPQPAKIEAGGAAKSSTKSSIVREPAMASRAPRPLSPWVLPEVDKILDPATPTAQQTNIEQERARLIEETLASFGAPAHVVDISRGPTITRFGVEPDFIESRSGRMRVRVSKIASLADDLSLALAAPRIRIQAPVPGRSYVGIEVPNIEISLVSMREVIDSEAFRRIRSSLRFTLGKDVAGKPAAADLALMPHLLIAGTTGSGKSVCVNSVLTCLLLHNTPADLRLVLVDPKRVELTNYNGIPHLLAPVVVDT